MHYTLLRLYKEGRLSLQGLENAVAKDWITEGQKEQIIRDVG